MATYTSKLAAHQKRTSLRDAVVTGLCKIGEHRAALGVMDFSFLGGSMGSVVGEKLTRLIERATEKELPVIIISSSGGARMYEGMFSLMQMAKTSAALAYHAQQRLPYISVLTHPTTAGVMASYASLGDLILAEPGAMIGFAGPRVIKDTTQAELPPGFQTAEFLLDRGLIDAIVMRTEMKERLMEYLSFLAVRKKRRRRRVGIRFSPPAVVPQGAGFAAFQRAPVEEHAHQQFEVVPHRVQPHLPRGGHQRMPVQNDNLPVRFPGQLLQPLAQFQFLRREHFIVKAAELPERRGFTENK